MIQNLGSDCMENKYHVHATAITHIDFGIIGANDEGKISQQIMKERFSILGIT
jgi:hypothetical protein